MLAAVWPTEVVLADCDPAGGDLALLARTPAGEVLDPDRGLLSLAADARRGVGARDVAAHLQHVDGGTAVLCGIGAPEQMTGLGPMWPTLAQLLHRLPTANVVADLGRLVPDTPVLPLVQACDALVMIVRPSVEAFGHLRERLRWLASLEQLPGGAPAVGVLVVTESSDRRSATDLQRLLASSGITVPVLGTIALDRHAADVVQGRLDRGLSRSLLVRSVRSLVPSLRALADTRGFAHAQV
ncbi:hypothetical protein OEB99_09515 [Actinotalea sp. M2MS4P-6]|uniref:hypothetical protein n=1 Tax=Actinotalea sp. M2MS4P-6 TaxID=2983762 RepID=UPI0021E3DAAC|nr:hypothetical protein [Actinotalea sp. M2MS4P-6]MCV2394543.1 hypothetical protein [Actinotalea sp. M2MS4P-6]